MHYEINYKGFATVAAADAAAIADVQEFMGAERFERLRAIYTESAPVAEDLFRLQLSFAGIGGYPVEALRRLFWPAGEVIEAVRDLDFTVC